MRINTLWRPAILTIAFAALAPLSSAHADVVAGPAGPTISVKPANLPIDGPVAGPVATFPGQPNARITAVVDKPVFYLGENVMIRLHIRNVSDKPFDVDRGGDGEDREREIRFHITAIDQHGVPAADPWPFDDSMGGLEGPTSVTKGDGVWFATPLMSYCRIEHPGTYTITVSHDLGWTNRQDNGPNTDLHTHTGLPTATVVVKFVMPTPSQARRVFAEQEASPGGETLLGEPPPTDRDWSGKPGDDEERDFSQMRFPVYLPLLAAHASRDSGNSFADDVAGIGAMPTPEATAELIRLMGTCNADCAGAAAKVLGQRLLDPRFKGTKSADYARLPAGWIEAYEYLYVRSWRPDLFTRARAAAERLLIAPSQNAIDAAAYIISSIGEKDELPLVVSALNRDTALNEATPIYPNNVFPPENDYEPAVESLMNAATYLIARGAPAITRPSSPAERLIWTAENDAKPVADWPAGWQDITRSIFSTPNDTLRALALGNIEDKASDPQLAAILIDYLPQMLNENDSNLRTYAVWAAGYVHSPTLNPTLLKILESMDLTQSNEMVSVLNKNGATWDALNVLIYRAETSNPEMDSTAQYTEGEMFNLVAGSNPSSYFGQLYSSDTLAYVLKWRAFINYHKAEIQAGKKWPADDPEIQALFPPPVKADGPPGSD